MFPVGLLTPQAQLLRSASRRIDMAPSRSCLLLMALVLVGAAACSSGSTDTGTSPVHVASSHPSSVTAPSATGNRPSTPRRGKHLSPDRIVGPYAASVLVDAALVRHGHTYDVVTSWSSTRPRHQGERALLVTTRSGSRALRWTQARAIRLLRSFPDRDPTADSALSPLLVATATSLAPGTRAVVAGGDGATLLPFEQVARDTGSGWQTFDVPRLHGDETAYVSGQVVLPDGRLVVALAAWSGDRAARRSRPPQWSDAHHGLWVTHGEDWSRWVPFTPTLARGSSFDLEPGTGSAYSSLGASTRGDAAVWFVAQDMVFASPDGRVFRRVELTS